LRVTECRELQPDRARRIDELRQEGEEEGRRLGIERLDEDAVAKGAPVADARRVRRQDGACLAHRLHPEPDQIERAGELQQREGLGARHDQCRHADCTRQHMDQSADRRAEARGETFAAATGDRAGGDVEDAGSGRQRDDRGGRQEEEKGHAAP